MKLLRDLGRSWADQKTENLVTHFEKIGIQAHLVEEPVKGWLSTSPRQMIVLADQDIDAVRITTGGDDTRPQIHYLIRRVSGDPTGLKVKTKATGLSWFGGRVRGVTWVGKALAGWLDQFPPDYRSRKEWHGKQACE